MEKEGTNFYSQFPPFVSARVPSPPVSDTLLIVALRSRRLRVPWVFKLNRLFAENDPPSVPVVAGPKFIRHVAIIAPAVWMGR